MHYQSPLCWCWYKSSAKPWWFPSRFGMWLQGPTTSRWLNHQHPKLRWERVDWELTFCSIWQEGFWNQHLFSEEKIQTGRNVRQAPTPWFGRWRWPFWEKMEMVDGGSSDQNFDWDFRVSATDCDREREVEVWIKSDYIYLIRLGISDNFEDLWF